MSDIPAFDTPAFEISIRYEKALFKRAAWAYIKGMLFRNKRLVGILLLLATVLALLLLAMLGLILLRGCPLPRLGYSIQMLIVAVLVLAILTPLLYGLLYRRTVQNSERFAAKMSDRTVRMFFGPETFHFHCELADSQINWKLFLKAQTGPDIWLLFPNPLQFYILPVEALSPELQDYILARLRENGVPIRNI